MIDMFIFAIWYLLPAGVGNMVPIFAARLPALRGWIAPLDGGHMWRGKRIFGPHKTIRGLVVGIIAGGFIGLLQGLLVSNTSLMQDTPLNLYQGLTPIYLGMLLAGGALLGDAIESFFKRQYGVLSGDSWFPFDQIDYIIGACILGSVLGVLSLEQYALILVLWFGLHLASSYIGYLLHLKIKPI